MEIIIFLIPMALLLGGLFLAGFIWMTLNGQYDDLETPAHRMLLDDNDINKTDNNKNMTQEGEL